MVRKFFCLRLETAAMLAGWLGTIGSLVSIIFFGLCLGFVDTINKNIIDLQSNENKKPVYSEENRTLLVMIFMSYLIFNAINLAASFALLLGTYKEKHLLILPWLANSAMSLTVHLTSYMVLVVQTMEMSSSTGYLSLIFGAIGLGVYIYLWMAVYSHFKILQGTRDEEKALLRPENRTSYTKA